MTEQACDLRRVARRPGRYRCARKGCTNPPLQMPIRAKTGARWKLSEFVPPTCTVPYRDPRWHVLATRFLRAWTLHLLRGSPATPEHARAARLAICQTCPEYDGRKCKKCGCGIKTTKAWLDKLGWADQSCPIGKWGPVELAPRFEWARAWLEYLSPYCKAPERRL